jgi:hypothetical protein
MDRKEVRGGGSASLCVSLLSAVTLALAGRVLFGGLGDVVGPGLLPRALTHRRGQVPFTACVRDSAFIVR